MLKQITIGVLILLFWFAAARAAWIGIFRPNQALEWIDENLPSMLGYWKLFLHTPEQQLWWMRFQCLFLLVLLVLLAVEGSLWAINYQQA